MKRRYRCYNIKWDTDGYSPKRLGLPSETIIESDGRPDFDCEWDGADVLSDTFGYCVFSFEFEEVKA